MTDLSIGEALIGLLADYGVDTIFGIPGVHNVEMYRALPRSKIRHVLPRHEQGAGFMADGYARATGKPGVCFTITGPGLTNILTPLGQAWSDSSNVLVISTALDVGDSAQGRGLCMKWSISSAPRRASLQIHRGFIQAMICRTLWPAVLQVSPVPGHDPPISKYRLIS